MGFGYRLYPSYFFRAVRIFREQSFYTTTHLQIIQLLSIQFAFFSVAGSDIDE